MATALKSKSFQRNLLLQRYYNLITLLLLPFYNLITNGDVTYLSHE